MRGEVIQYSGGSGLISGDDGARYTFTDEQIGPDAKLRVGSRVDFVVTKGAASAIYPVAGGVEPVETTNEDLSVWEYFKKCLRLYAEGNGRARRKEYWSFVLFTWLFVIGAAMLLVIPFTMIGAATGDEAIAGVMTATLVLVIVAIMLGLLIPSYAVLSRRLHDVGMSGWFALLSLIPYLGGLFVLVIALIPSQMAKNQYGAYPKPLPPS